LPEFLGMTNVLHGAVSSGGEWVQVAGASVQYKGMPGGSVVVVFKADQALLTTADSWPDEMVAFSGSLEEACFIGTVYRHYINLNGEMILVDSQTKISTTRVCVLVPRDKINIYAG
jgi:hypothetical protein